MNVWTVVRAAWHGRGVYGWQDWTDRVDRAAMVGDWRRAR